MPIGIGLGDYKMSDETFIRAIIGALFVSWLISAGMAYQTGALNSQFFMQTAHLIAGLGLRSGGWPEIETAYSRRQWDSNTIHAGRESNRE